jgi:hypothetical protein
MPNTQTSVPLYASGEVLTAANLNLTNSGIPVFATTVTRDAAFGGANEKVLAEGQFAYIEATNTTQYYDGANWQTVGITPGLVCVKAETAFTTSSSITADNVFSSAYTNYRIMIRMTAAGNVNTFLRLRVGGVSSSAANYNRQNLNVASTSVAGVRATGETSFNLNGVNGAFFTTNMIDIFAPFLAEPTNLQFVNNQTDGAYTAPYIYITNANNSLSTSFDGFEFFPSSTTLTGTYTVYGYGKTV